MSKKCKHEYFLESEDENKMRKEFIKGLRGKYKDKLNDTTKDNAYVECPECMEKQPDEAMCEANSNAVLDDRCRSYQNTINQIEDYLEYRYRADTQEEMRNKIIIYIDQLAANITKKCGNVD